jgi:hypothetical protein
VVPEADRDGQRPSRADFNRSTGLYLCMTNGEKKGKRNSRMMRGKQKKTFQVGIVI